MNDRADWLRWRRLGLGSSDYASIMHCSKWQTLLQLYESKLQETHIEEKTSYIMERGNEIEPKVRALYELQRGKSFSAKLLVMEGFEFMRVSLDGADESGEEIIEIKLLGKADYEAAREHKKVPPHYVPQIQGQLLVSRAKVCHLLGYPYSKEREQMLDPEKIVVVDVLPDTEYQSKLLSECQKFWHDHVQKKVPPGAETDDWKELTGVESDIELWQKLDLHVSRLEDEIKTLDVERQVLQDRILTAAEKTGAKRLYCGVTRVERKSRKGNINYKTIPQLAGVDLEPFRGDTINYWTMKRGE